MLTPPPSLPPSIHPPSTPHPTPGTSLHRHQPPPVVDSVLDLIGATPMLRVTGFDTGACELFLKLESCNPGGSIKDRIALAMVDAAEREGRLRPGGRIFEATAGARCWRRCRILMMLPACI